MKNYKSINNLVGWVVFAIAALTYILTTEASASFWDCGEFIATADKLLVGHPPGAPLFMIMGRFFAILAPNAALVAKFINVMSALASAFTILFLFWTITHLARKIFIGESTEGAEPWKIWLVMGAGAVGALAYTFSDTFWFSAVEGEVYGMSSLFTALVFWLILKWEADPDEDHSGRWLLLIAYLMGLSIGVHLLNLLCIPAIGLVYYYKKSKKTTVVAGQKSATKYDVTTGGVIKALLVSCVILGAILYGVIPGLVQIAGVFELLFVNGMHLPYNSGAIFWFILLTALTVWGIWATYKSGKHLLNLVLSAFALIVLGYSSFAMVVVRSASDPTMDQNSPDNVFDLISYLNREQYGDRPLFHGQTFVSPLSSSSSDGDPIYIKKNGRYEVADHKPQFTYQATMLFPRMYSSQAGHISQYKSWSGYKGTPVQVKDDEGVKTVMRPTMLENLKFFFKYQVGFMYLRYFMWNFSGRQNDIQGHGELTHGNWITGISFIDNAMLGDQSLLPDSLRENKGNNKYYMLPLILGLIGLFYQYGKGTEGKQGFLVVMLLFFMTGLAIVLYLNQTPLQPRERDYAYAGSFYAFSIWIGLGVLYIIEALATKLPKQVTAIATTCALLLAVPGVMAQQNWDDHDRSGCTIARDIAYNYLQTCEKDAVIFTNGDNDTFPLWYIQEVEGERPDVRICNLSYLQTEWYTDQMKRQAYDSKPLPISFTHEQYTHDRDIVYLIANTDDYVTVKDAYDFLKSENPRTKSLPNHPGRICFIPATKFMIPVNKDEVRASGIVSADKDSLIVDAIRINFPQRYMTKANIFVIDMVNESKWKRPLYYAVTVGSENYVGLQDYFSLEGLAYRITPIYTPSNEQTGQVGCVDTERMYDNVMNKFRWGFYNREGQYLDENKTRMGSNLRNNLTRLATTLLDEAAAASDSLVAQEKREKAVKVLDKIQEEIPSWAVAHNYFSMELAEDYYRAGENEKGDAIVKEYGSENWKEMCFYLSVYDTEKQMNESLRRCVAIHGVIERTCEKYQRKEIGDEMASMFDSVEDVLRQVFRY